ncbi:glycosyl transferase family 2 [Fibrella aestuarina BUZ 2]|uniref:Glycosyl transferase family 2 n=1 Tax=Fibrella aestuarina BUZ 2 TaxID=1166018 RepID=I0K648_9BACT|nr:glycosyltransferase family 2 protein [Fibrella aestuarina]CCG99601.1 glycosyl transferase family 2 [Fibrella aestuarina BUZ 2]
MLPVTVLVLTKNEEPNVLHCLRSVVGWAAAVFVLDSGSTDRTVELAEAAGATVFHRDFDNYAAQRNYALQALPIATDWVLFLDADEYIDQALQQEIGHVMTQPASHAGYFMAFKFVFMNRWIRRGGYYPTYILRLFKRAAVQQIDRLMDEQITVNGSVGYLQTPFIHHDRKPVLFWYEKHVRYVPYQLADLTPKEQSLHWADATNQRARKRWVKEQVWVRIPPLLRPFLYFVYRYVLLLGFLDGRAGFIFHVSHAFLYQFMIAAVYLDQKKPSPLAVPLPQ